MNTVCPECLRDLGETINVPAGQTCPGCGTFTAPVPDGASPAAKTSPVKLTQKVRRGLALAMELVADTLSPDSAPGYTTVGLRWGRAQLGDFLAAMAWLEENAAEEWLDASPARLRGRIEYLVKGAYRG